MNLQKIHTINLANLLAFYYTAATRLLNGTWNINSFIVSPL